VAQVRAGGVCCYDHVCLHRGEPAYEIDDFFVATNLVLLIAAFVGLTAFRVFFDIFAAIASSACTSVVPAVCGRATRPRHRQQRLPRTVRSRARSRLAFARVRFVPDPT
jgi:hypothetical protein